MFERNLPSQVFRLLFRRNPHPREITLQKPPEFELEKLHKEMPQAWKVRQNIKNASRQSVEALANLELYDDVSKPVPGSKAA